MNSLEVIRQLLLTHLKQKLLTSTVRIWVDHHGTVKWYLALLSYLQSWFFLVTPLRIFNYGGKRLIRQTVQTLLSYSRVRFSPYSSSMIRHLLWVMITVSHAPAASDQSLQHIIMAFKLSNSHKIMGHS
jgi:hypothetical protein